MYNTILRSFHFSGKFSLLLLQFNFVRFNICLYNKKSFRFCFIKFYKGF